MDWRMHLQDARFVYFGGVCETLDARVLASDSGLPRC
jgi:hypothetical protein